MTVKISIQREPEAVDLPLPSYATLGAAGMDVCAALPTEIILPPGGRTQVSAGFRLAIPEGYEAQIRPRSGLALNYGLGMVNSPGTIDCDYRGVVSVLLINWGQEAITIRRGDRIAQLVVAPVTRVVWQECSEDALPPTARNQGGFGHTGVE
jgi:dUTP pyrophosphatase